jgi:hypothetical protein
VDTASYDAVLRAVVRSDGVDYAALRAQHLPALSRWLERWAAAGATASLPREVRLAVLVDVYNATVLREVARRLEPGFSVAQDDFALFEERLVRLDGATISLDRLEHELIREGFGEPRVHAALVCAARSCPAPLDRAWSGLDDLEATLEARMRDFLADPARNRVDAGARTLRLSAIFDWFAEDFGGRQALAAWVDRYVDGDVSDWTVTFLDYSWELNAARR